MPHPYKRHSAFRLVMLRKMSLVIGNESALRPYCTGSASTRSGRLLICFFIHSKEEKKMVLITHERAMDTPRPNMS